MAKQDSVELEFTNRLLDSMFVTPTQLAVGRTIEAKTHETEIKTTLEILTHLELQELKVKEEIEDLYDKKESSTKPTKRYDKLIELAEDRLGKLNQTKAELEATLKPIKK